MPAPKEAFYDEHISPLMAKIIDLCKEHKINMAAQFCLGNDDDHNNEPLFCTTVLGNLDPDDTEGTKRVKELYDLMRAKQPQLLAFTITSNN